MPTLLTGTAADPTTSPQASGPADTEAGNASTVNTPFTTILNFISWLRTNGAFKAVFNTFSASQAFSAGLTASGGASAYAVDATGAPNIAAIHATTSGSGNGIMGTGGSANGAGVYGAGGGAGPGVQGLGGASGSGGDFAGNANRGALRLAPQAAPAAPADGDMWVELTTNTLKVRINGVTKTVTLT